MQPGQTDSPAGAGLKRLQAIPGIGKSLAQDLWRLGIREVADLKGRSPREMYRTLNGLTGNRQDPCVLYTFRCAVYFASEPEPEDRKLRWWYWKDHEWEPGQQHP